MRLTLPDELVAISKAITKAGGSAVVVGGAVRDALLQIEVKDYDIEVYGIETIERLEAILATFGRVNLVGKSFGILKLHTDEREYDFALPRKEKKVAAGHRGFAVEVESGLTFKEAARRRDFTINAMGYEIERGILLDPYEGKSDLEQKRLRHVDAKTFVEDPLRLYRGVQFAARFQLHVDSSTAALCQSMVAQGMLEELPKERVFEEWKKLLLKAPNPSVGFELMREWGVIARHFLELHALIGTPQDPTWHPEGDVWVHTLMSIDAMASILRVQGSGLRGKKKLKLLFAVLCHDLGKPITTTIELENGEIIKWKDFQNKSISKEMHTKTIHPIKRIRAIGHEQAGIEPTQNFIYRLTNEHDFIEGIVPLVEHHLKPSLFYAQGAKAGAIRRLATKVNIEELVMVAKADFLGRTTPEAQRGVYEAGEWLLAKAKALDVAKEPMKPWVQGRDLIALGLQPSPAFKTILDTLYEGQMEGKFRSKEEALAYCQSHYLL